MFKRTLTEDEIEYILDFIVHQNGIHVDSAMSIVENNKNRLKKQLLTQLVYPEIIQTLKENIKKSYIKTIIHPGESVGILTAQSIGEKQTQLTLNSITYDTKIIYKDKKLTNIVIEIGSLIDNLLYKYPNNIEYILENNTMFLNIENYSLTIPSCDENGISTWDKIIGVSKHLPNGNLVKIKTQLGREVTATKSKSFIVWNGTKFLPTNGSDIKIGDILPTISKLENKFSEFSYNLKIGEFFNFNEYQDVNIPYTYEFGFFIGLYITNGYNVNGKIYIKNKNINIINNIIKFTDTVEDTFISYNKKYTIISSVMLSKLLYITCGTNNNIIIPKFSMYKDTSINFVKGLISGYYSMNGKIYKRDHSITISSISQELIYGISFLLSSFGIIGKFSKRKNNTTLSLRNINVPIFASYFNWIGKESILSNYYTEFYGRYMEDFPKDRDIYFDRIISVELVEVSQDIYVYDLETENTKNFSLYNGLVCRDSFHKAGLSDKMVVSGVSKFAELINATKNLKETSCVAYFNEGNNTIQELRNIIGYSIIEHSLKTLSSSMKVSVNKQPEPWYEAYKILYNDKFEQYTDCISIQLKLNILFEIKLNIDEIVNFIEEEYSDMACVFSSSGKLDIYIDTSNIDLPEDREIYIDSNIINIIYLEEVVMPILENFRISGIPGIKNIFYIKNAIDNNWYIETDGSNFNKLMAHPKIDMTRVISNNVWDIYNTLGIEAARHFLITEFSNIMDGVTSCHIKLLVERMTFSGSITSISRYTMRADESGPLGKCSFEESIDGFCKAGAYGEEEPTKGISSCIIVGKRSNIGTGCMELRIDISKLPKAKTILTEVKENN